LCLDLSEGTVRHLGGTVESLATGVNEAGPAIGRYKDSWLTDHPLAGLATAMKHAMALGGDTDTTAAIVGGILACQLEDAEGQIPWLSNVGMPDARLIEATAAGL
jgi:hypothetical protein